MVDPAPVNTDPYRHLPLAAHRLFHSAHLDQARAIVASRFCPHRLDQRRRGERLDAIHCRVEGELLSLNVIGYGAEVEIDPGELGSFYLLQVPRSGGARVWHGGECHEVGTGTATLLNPDRPTRMRWGPGCIKQLVQWDSERLREQVAQWLERPLADTPVFAPALDGAALARLGPVLAALFGAAERGQLASGAAREREEALLWRVLESQRSSVSHLLAEGPPCRGQPAPLRRAREYIFAHLHRPLRLAEIAAAAHTSVRNLQHLWRRHHGSSVSSWIGRQRLLALHQRLLARRAGDSVAAAGRAVGLAHPGRAAGQYAQLFGRVPGQTAALAHRAVKLRA